MLDLCHDALLVSRELNDRYGEADALDSLGYAYRHAGAADASIRSYEQAITLYRQLGSRYAEASALEYLSEVHVGEGALDRARSPRPRRSTSSVSSACPTWPGWRAGWPNSADPAGRVADNALAHGRA